jgi:2-dehydro-3-deoxyphosphogluconate aldolase/(4S)-4-hydroxy-2-oxoglutarate aldolase
MSQQTTIQTILDYPLVPVFYHPAPDTALGVFNACYTSGIRVFELTNRGANALEIFKLLRSKLRNYPGYILGAGTILKDTDAAAFIEAGADFIVSPCFIDTVFDISYQNKIPYLPGCMTVKEVFYATEAGCEIIKIFPGEVVGTSFVKAVKAVLPSVKLMITGGVSPDKESITSWFQSGASAVGIGSQLFKSELLQKGDFTAIEEAVVQCFKYLP